MYKNAVFTQDVLFTVQMILIQKHDDMTSEVVWFPIQPEKTKCEKQSLIYLVCII